MLAVIIMNNAVNYVASIWEKDGVRKLEQKDKPQQKTHQNIYMWFRHNKNNTKQIDAFNNELSKRFHLSVEECENYRPISLLCVTYKLFAALVLHRLQLAGAEDRLTTQ